MQRFERIAALRAFVAGERRAGRRVGFVPTMGNLHAGHYALIEMARRHADVVVASVFVNPTQFGPGEDYARYPRTPEQDSRGLAERGCDVLFQPSVEQIYPHGPADAVRISVPGLGDVLEGASRPGHFDGVATVLGKLFLCVGPDIAVFGRKDYQQLLVVRRLVADLAFPMEILDVETFREPNGLAMSSRNRYLDAKQREQAAAIHAILQWMRAQARDHGHHLDSIEAAARSRLEQAGLAPDYVVIRRAADLAVPTDDFRHGLIALVAARLGPVRLIDNLLLDEARVEA
ncbi:MAG TPA: pantoate--beta-alanine ligase [Rhodanobacteraceae bacterium]|nr:pantoate--beta-alanine ligase [Rhodanobacteraceae bacterium]